MDRSREFYSLKYTQVLQSLLWCRYAAPMIRKGGASQLKLAQSFFRHRHSYWFTTAPQLLAISVDAGVARKGLLAYY